MVMLVIVTSTLIVASFEEFPSKMAVSPPPGAEPPCQFAPSDQLLVAPAPIQVKLGTTANCQLVLLPKSELLVPIALMVLPPAAFESFTRTKLSVVLDPV